MNAFDVTPAQAARGRRVPDHDLPMLAAEWLTEGWDGPLLRELAGLTHRDSNEAAHLLPQVLAELGHAPHQFSDPFEGPWLGYWDTIWWYVKDMDVTHSPYATAQRMIELVSDQPELWEPGHGAELSALLQKWDRKKRKREAIDARIRQVLHGLSEGDVRAID